MITNRQKEYIKPYLAAIIALVLYLSLCSFGHCNTNFNLSSIFVLIASISSILFGFLMVTFGSFLSMGNRYKVKQLKDIGRFESIVNLFFVSITSNFYTVILALVSTILINSDHVSHTSRSCSISIKILYCCSIVDFLAGLTVSVLAFALTSAYQILELFFIIAKDDN